MQWITKEYYEQLYANILVKLGIMKFWQNIIPGIKQEIVTLNSLIFIKEIEFVSKILPKRKTYDAVGFIGKFYQINI